MKESKKIIALFVGVGAVVASLCYPKGPLKMIDDIARLLTTPKAPVAHVTTVAPAAGSELRPRPEAPAPTVYTIKLNPQGPAQK